MMRIDSLYLFNDYVSIQANFFHSGKENLRTRIRPNYDYDD